MHEKKGALPQTKSYTGITDIFGSTPFNNVLYRNPRKPKEQCATGVTVKEADKKTIIKNPDFQKEHSVYVTSEKYHGLNRNLSYMSIAHSTSTIFCDLDDLTKRHSFHCLTEVSISNANILKVMKLPIGKNGFEVNSNAIVQECATQIKTKLPAKDSMEINAKKVKRAYHNDCLSSEIFLRDRSKYKKPGKYHYYNIDIANNHQKFWSYAKYRTEYTKPIPIEEKRTKKKDRGKRTEDPCPCQLFSYACPCTDEKSLCELAKNSICVADQITSTTKISKKIVNDCDREHKLTSTSVIESNKAVKPGSETIIDKDEKQDVPVHPEVVVTRSPINRRRKQKRTHKVTCPNCKEKVEVISTTEEEECIKLEDSLIYHNRDMTPTFNCSTLFKDNNRYKIFEDGDVCNHDPRCELVPICQILPIEEVFLNNKSSKKRTSVKSTPRVIRITKACRHHPPCTVVPSCQRANVLRNNCEFIPPCLHRPRCINLPLCIPFSKSIHCDDPYQNLEDESPKCPHPSRRKYIQECQQDIGDNVDQYNMITRVQTPCDYGKEAYGNNTKTTIMSVMSPGQLMVGQCCSCKSNKSCQYQCSECHCVYSLHKPKAGMSSEAIVFIRDVGCQFKNKIYSPKNSIIRSKTSSASFDLEDVKPGTYYTAVHTMRLEDKFTNPKSGNDSASNDSSISMAVDSQCPSHGRRSSRNPCIGFISNQLYTTGFVKSDKTPAFLHKRHKDLSKSDVLRCRETFPVRSRRSFSKGRYRKIRAAKRRRKSKTSNHVVTKKADD